MWFWEIIDRVPVLLRKQDSDFGCNSCSTSTRKSKHFLELFTLLEATAVDQNENTALFLAVYRLLRFNAAAYRKNMSVLNWVDVVT